MDFLTFKTFLSQQALIFFYYLGAVVFPVGVWYLTFSLLRKYDVVNDIYNQGKEIFWKTFNYHQRVKMLILFVILFLFMELFWRMLFEFLIAYMQIRDALIKLPA